jgi:hypothetical protein
MLRSTTAFLIFALVCTPESALASENSIWIVRTLRIEGAAVGVRRSAESAQNIAINISNTKTLKDLAPLQSQLDELHRLVVSARLSIEVAKEELEPERPLKSSN